MTKIRKYQNSGALFLSSQSGLFPQLSGNGIPQFSHTSPTGYQFLTLGDRVGNALGGNYAAGFRLQSYDALEGMGSTLIQGAIANPGPGGQQLLLTGLDMYLSVFNSKMADVTGGFDLNEKKPGPGKFSSFMNKNGLAVGLGADIANSLSDSIFGLKRGMDGPHAEMTAGIDATYNAASDAMMQINPMVGGIMKAAGFVGNTINKVGGGTDGMTGADAALNSIPGTLLTLGLNGFLGDTTENFSKNEEAFAQVGSSYGGTGSVIDDALSKAGKKYGLVSGGARTEANRLIRKAKTQLQVMEGIADSSRDAFDIQSSMSAINGNRRAFHMLGGYDLSSIRVGRNGLSIQSLITAKRVVSSYRMAQKMQKGGKTSDPFTEYVNSLPENQRNGADFRIKDYWSFNGKPKDFLEAISKGMFTLMEDGWHANSVAENPETGEIEFMKSSSHPTHHMEVDWYNSEDPEATKFRSEWELQQTEPYWKYVRRKPQTTEHFREGGTIEALPRYTVLEEVVDVESYLQRFQNGGTFNVIPEGALHARLNHMETENITKKGIPVVSEGEGGEILQQAEIEREEIIFRLEVTKKLEELAKDGSDEAAVEAGKLLTYEILHNTIDNTLNLL